MLVLKASVLCIIAVALCLAANFARAESYGSDAPSVGPAVARAQTKPKPVRVVTKLYVVHPGVVADVKKRRGK